MKFSELKNKFKNKYAIRVIAGVLMVAMLGTSYGVWQVNAAKPSTESVSEEATEKETSTEETDTEDGSTLIEDIISLCIPGYFISILFEGLIAFYILDIL